MPKDDRCFLLDGDRYTTIEPPEPGVELFPTWDRGQIVGEYSMPKEASMPSCVTKVVAPSGARASSPPSITRMALAGPLPSASTTAAIVDASKESAFVRDKRGDGFATIDVPGAQGTEPHRINNRGQIVGLYSDSEGTMHGFLLDDDEFTTIDHPIRPIVNNSARPERSSSASTTAARSWANTSMPTYAATVSC